MMDNTSFVIHYIIKLEVGTSRRDETPQRLLKIGSRSRFKEGSIDMLWKYNEKYSMHVETTIVISWKDRWSFDKMSLVNTW